MIDLSACESPLEVELGKAIAAVCGDALVSDGTRSEDGVIGALPGWNSLLVSQPNLDWCRPDFMILSVFRFNLIDQGWADATRRDQVEENVLIIEVDGHDFHERTKAQARRDRARDRRMIEHGWTPLRFTGQEVYEDAIACAEQACHLFIERQRRVMNAGFLNYLKWLTKQPGEANS